MFQRIPLPFKHAPGEIVGYTPKGRPVYAVAGGAYSDPPANASDNVSPVTASQTPEGKLLSVGPRDGAGLPTGSDVLDTLITRSYQLAAYGVLRRRLVFDSIAQDLFTKQSHNGAVLSLNLVNDLDDAVSTALLVEDFDVLPTPLASFRTDLILKEYGRVVTTTALIRGTSMVPLNPIAAERVGRNAAATLDKLALQVALAAGGITNAGAANGSIPTDVTVAGKPSDTLRAASQSFKDNNVEPMPSGLYRAFLSPAAETALRKEADASGWRYWQINQDPSGGTGSIPRGYVGQYEGFEIVVSTGVGSTGGIFAGEGALAKGSSSAPGFGSMPEVIVSPVVDRLKRFASIGWYWLGGYARFRAEAIVTGNPAG